MTYYSTFSHRLLINLCFILIITGFVLSFELLEQWIQPICTFHFAQLCFLIPSGYFSYNLLKNLLQSEKTLMFEEMESERILYATRIKIPNIVQRILRIGLIPIIGGMIIYFYLFTQVLFAYGLTILILVFTVMGSLPALKELLVKPFRLYLTDTGIFYFWLNYQEIHWSEIEKVELSDNILFFQRKDEEETWLKLSALSESPVFLLTALKSELNKHDILHNLE